MPGYEFLIKPKNTLISITTEQVQSTLYSLLLLEHSLDSSGLSSSLIEINNSLSDDIKMRNKVVMNGLYHSVIPVKEVSDFNGYLDQLRNIDPVILRDRTLNMYFSIHQKKIGNVPEQADILRDSDAYISFLLNIFGEEKIDVEIEREAYKYIINPEKMKDLIISHLFHMWDLYFRKEWEINESILEESVRLYREAGIEELSKMDALKFIGCGSDDCDWDTLSEKINGAKRLYLVPSAHLGPYKGKIYNHETDVMWLFYGSLIPEGSRLSTPELSQADLLIRFNALIDGTRLKILKMCSLGSEYSSTQIMSELNLSQSAVSRHLKQLSATGFLHERRENSSKFYTINKQKINNTISSFAGYLNLDSDSK